MNNSNSSLSHTVSINFKYAFNSMPNEELLKIKNTIINIDTTHKISSIIFKELNFSNFIDNNTDKQNRLKFVYDILESTNFSSLSNTIHSIDLSNNNLNDNDLQYLIKAINNNHKSQYFNSITSINLSFNSFNNNSIINKLFQTLGTKFIHLASINLEQSGILYTIYNSDKLQTFNVNASITWFTTNINNENTIEFQFVDESDEEEEEDDDNDNDISHSDDNLFDNEIYTSDNGILYDNDYDYNSGDIDSNNPELHIAYSLGIYPSNSICK